jgi:integrase
MPVIDQFLSELSKSSDHTRRCMEFYARKFLQFAEGRPFSEWNKELVNAFLAELESEGYAPGTRRTVYGIVKRVFDAARSVHEAERTKLISSIDPDDRSAIARVLQAMSLPGPTWDLGKRSAPKVEREDEVKPTATFEQLSTMIEATRKGLDGAANVYLALASVYGLRRGELCSVRREHIDFKAKTLYVMTEKGGDRRQQLLCDEVLALLRDYKFKKEYSLFQMSSLFRSICYAAAIEPAEGENWHSVRRYLDTELVNIFGEQNRIKVKIFLRWRLSASADMSERYYGCNPLVVDKEVLEGHPAVPLWR